MKIHFIAMGGSAMHSLAIALKHQGHEISGSDDEIYEPAATLLKQNNLLPEVSGWFPEKITHALDAVILGMHAKADNPELRKAQELNLKIYSYPEFIFEQSKEKTRVVIAGSHGKTTITAMVLHALKYHGYETDYMIGAKVKGFKTTVNLTSTNDFIVLEGDEYLSSALDLRPKFLHYRPTVALLSGIAWDHVNVFKTFEEYKDAFKNFIASLTPGAALIFNEEDENVTDLVENAQNYFRKLPYKTPDFSEHKGGTMLLTDVGEVPLKIFGKHNLLNLNGTKEVCQQLGIMEEEFYEAIMTFEGASQRLEKVSRKDSAVVYRDFAHAPSKVKATAEAFKEKFKGKKLLAMLELHTYSSLQPDFIANYAHSLDGFDEAVVFISAETLSVKGMNPISGETLREAFAKQDLKFFSDKEDLQNYWHNLNKEDFAILAMSSGHFGGINLSA